MTHVGPLRVQCLARKGDVLWACSSEASGFVAGTSPDAGRTFAAQLHLRDIGGPLECAGGASVAKECARDWQKLRNDLGLGDGARGDAGPRPAIGTPRTEEPIVTTRTLWAAIALATLVGVALTVRSRSRKR